MLQNMATHDDNIFCEGNPDCTVSCPCQLSADWKVNQESLYIMSQC